MKFLLSCVLTLLQIAPALAAGSDDPGWPCVQRKQPHLSLGAMWAGPPPDPSVEELAKRPDIVTLGRALYQRRLPMQEAELQIAAFAEKASAQELTALFMAAFEPLDSYRSQIIGGIERYAVKQTELSKQIEGRREEMARLTSAETQDFDQIDEVEKQLDWDTRVFTDRQQSLTYVCETPVLLEQRAFAIAHAIAAHLP